MIRTADEQREYRFMVMLLLLFAASAAALTVAYVRSGQENTADFFGIWSWAQFAATQPLDGLYDVPTMHRFQAGLDPYYADSYYPFLYPPSYLLVIAALGYFDEYWARLLWSAMTAGLFAVSVLGMARRGMVLAFALLAPTTVLCLIAGQNGLLNAALMIGGLRLSERRPIAGGAIVGALGYKPHFALLVPLALVAGRRWHALLAAGASAVAMAMAAGLWFGPNLWLQWWAARAETWSVIAPFIAAKADLVPTVSAALRQIGAGDELTMAGQAVAGLLASWMLWTIWRQAPGSARAIAAVPVATLLVTPYAFFYDLPIVAGGLLLVWQDCWTRERSLSRADLMIGVLVLTLPLLMLATGGGRLPVAGPILLAALCWLTFPGFWMIGAGRLRIRPIEAPGVS